ncbi:MAG TPA: DUF2752 domain-containing protein [Thermoanaerobaculia bacterium]|nr:DUF2752 domain-containing protein [Thermoanaerobaculia bacterium]
MERAGVAAGVSRRPPAVQLGYLWGAAAASAAALALAAPGLVSRVASVLLPCPVKAFTNVPCPACGSGRATLALARLDLPAAFVSNPLFSLAALLFVAGGVVALALAVSGRGVPEPRTLSVTLRAGLVLAVVANWAWLVLDGR